MGIDPPIFDVNCQEHIAAKRRPPRRGKVWSDKDASETKQRAAGAAVSPRKRNESAKANTGLTRLWPDRGIAEKTSGPVLISTPLYYTTGTAYYGYTNRQTSCEQGSKAVADTFYCVIPQYSILAYVVTE